MKKSKDRSPRSKPRVLITGINGFVGSHLADLLVSENCDVHGMAVTRDMTHLREIKSRISVLYGDIRDAKAVENILSEAAPDRIYHLAGSAFVPDAEAHLRSVYEINVLGTLNLLEAVRSVCSGAKVLVISSGEVYGRLSEEALPAKEDDLLRPVSPYGVTKASADLLAYQYAAAYQLGVIRVRPFNHIGPRQSESFVCSSFAKQIVEIENGLRKPVLQVGNLEARRDFTDVRDVVRAYRLILEGGQGGDVYNVGSGKAWRIGDLLKMMIDRSAVREIKIQEQKARVRPNDIPVMICDPTKLVKELGWKPTIFIEQTLQDLLDYWREKTKA